MILASIAHQSANNFELQARILNPWNPKGTGNPEGLPKSLAVPPPAPWHCPSIAQSEKGICNSLDMLGIPPFELSVVRPDSGSHLVAAQLFQLS